MQQEIPEQYRPCKEFTDLYVDKEGKGDSRVLSRQEVQRLKETIDRYLQQKNGRKLLLFEDL